MQEYYFNYELESLNFARKKYSKLIKNGEIEIK